MSALPISALDEAAALADADMLEIERPDGDPEAVPPVPNSGLRVTSAKLLAYLFSKIVGGSGIRLSLASGTLTLESGGASSVEVAGASATLSLAHANRFIRFNNATAQTVTIPPQSSVAWPDDCQLEGAQWGAGAVSFVAGSGVTLRKAADISATSGGQYKPLGIKRVALNEWLLFGQFGGA
ncbi:hypothetical protein [Pseudoxanthomonas mexicana]|uniref:hypothetical protein n=1 Tax=Pseudoxanthomonas mexicana TaxID=128785 RepID=UPI00398A8031